MIQLSGIVSSEAPGREDSEHASQGTGTAVDLFFPCSANLWLILMMLFWCLQREPMVLRSKRPRRSLVSAFVPSFWPPWHGGEWHYSCVSSHCPAVTLNRTAHFKLRTWISLCMYLLFPSYVIFNWQAGTQSISCSNFKSNYFISFLHDFLNESMIKT